MSTEIDIRTKLAELADEFRRGKCDFALLYETSFDTGVSAEIHITFVCPFSKKKESIRFNQVFYTETEVEHWFARVTKVRPYLIRETQRSA